jgi:hypothetical protein
MRTPSRESNTIALTSSTRPVGEVFVYRPVALDAPM